MSEVEDRRQRAREAFWDASRNLGHGTADDVEACIEVATQVKITQEAVEAFGQAWQAADQGPTHEDGARRMAGLTAALTALGFEVIE